jgi:hypothetical protein
MELHSVNLVVLSWRLMGRRGRASSWRLGQADVGLRCRNACRGWGSWWCLVGIQLHARRNGHVRRRGGTKGARAPARVQALPPAPHGSTCAAACAAAAPHFHKSLRGRLHGLQADLLAVHDAGPTRHNPRRTQQPPDRLARAQGHVEFPDRKNDIMCVCVCVSVCVCVCVERTCVPPPKVR